MKLQTIFTASALLWCAGIAWGQTFSETQILDAAPGALLPASHQFMPGQLDCEAACQVPWSQYRNGALWENYCLEKQRCRDHAAASRTVSRAPEPHHAHTADASQSVCLPTRGRSSKACRISHRRERLLSFNIFCELLGWNDCRCRSDACRGARSCPADECGDAIGVPIPVPDISSDSAEGRAGSPVLEDVIEGDADILRPFGDSSESSILPGVEVPELAPADELSPVDAFEIESSDVEGLEQEVPDDGTAEPKVPGDRKPVRELPDAPPAPKDLTPEVPRNKLPGFRPASAPASRPTVIKILVAERLSEYIKT